MQGIILKIFSPLNFLEYGPVDPKVRNHAWVCNDFPNTKGFHKEQQRKWPDFRILL